MNFDLEGILKRMYAVTGTENNFQLSKYLGKRPGAVHAWKDKKTPPYEDCHKIAEQTGCNLMWLITGKSEQEAGSSEGSSNIPTNFPKIRNAFLKALTQGYEFGYLAHTVKTTDQTLDLMAGILYEELTGKDMEEVLEKTKQADAG